MVKLSDRCSGTSLCCSSVCVCVKWFMIKDFKKTEVEKQKERGREGGIVEKRNRERKEEREGGKEGERREGRKGGREGRRREGREGERKAGREGNDCS